MVAKKVQDEQGQVLLLERTYDASPERIFAAWTEPSLLAQWWGPPGSVVKDVEIDLREGGRYRVGIRTVPHSTYYVSGVYKIIEAPYKLVFTWRWENAAMDVGLSLVTIELRANGPQTDLRLKHEQLPTQEALRSHREGWMGILKALHDFVGT